MNRREMLAALGVAALPAAAYRPVGHLRYDSPGAGDVSLVTLDGLPVDMVTELNDVEGWLWHYAVRGTVRQHHRRGEVRVYFRAKR